ncbi:P-loop containing nucleoside triphosphate hydrolase protein [Serendipita vermifera]|nr:P-loop containing nucleoside triphosphate hydrolase protein [Serendipita vermifera]
MPPRILCLGDPHQAIYQFRGADARYLQLAREIFKDFNPYRWKGENLTKSFRLSYENADFVNSFIPQNAHIQGSHHGPKPIYLHADLKDVDSLLQELQPLVERYTPERSAILAPSIRGNFYLSALTNALSRNSQTPVAVSTFDEAPLDPDVIHGKLVASTYHQFKGSERDLIIVYGFDESYFQYYGAGLPDDRCPNAVFVAITRPVQQLVVVHQKGKSALPFLPLNKVLSTCQDRSEGSLPQRPPGRPLEIGLRLPKRIAVTEIPRHVNNSVLNDLFQYHLYIDEIKAPLPENQRIYFPDKVETDSSRGHYEAVSDLNGLAITAAFEWTVSAKCTTFGYYGKSPDIPEDPFLKARWFAKEAARYEAKTSGYRSRLLQMQNHPFNWLRGGLDKAVGRLRGQFPDFSLLNFEDKLSFRFRTNDADTHTSSKGIKIRGRADIVDYRPNVDKIPTIWEIKCVNSVSLEHFIQLATYGLMWSMKMERTSWKKLPFPRLILFNVRDGAISEIRTTRQNVLDLVEGLLRAKYTITGETSTDDFLRHHDEIRRSVNRASVTKSTKGKNEEQA